MQKAKTLYTITLEPWRSEALAAWCERYHWAFFSVQHACYAYRTEGIQVVFYQSGKLVIQGKKTEEFVLNVLEPEITKQPLLGVERETHPEWFIPHAGLDESGKGDLFGPLVTACVIAEDTCVDFWIKNGLKESKCVGSDARLFQMEKLVRSPHDVVIEFSYMSMEKYNQLYYQFGNLNELLGWLHARTLEKALARCPVKKGLLDQFSTSHLVQKHLKVKEFSLRQQIRAESDPVVAAASIIARAEYVRQLQALSQLAGIELPKGAGVQAKEALRELKNRKSEKELPQFVKMHFKTVHEV